MLSVCVRDPYSNFCTSYSIFMAFGMNVMPLLLTQICEAWSNSTATLWPCQDMLVLYLKICIVFFT